MPGHLLVSLFGKVEEYLSTFCIFCVSARIAYPPAPRRYLPETETKGIPGVVLGGSMLDGCTPFAVDMAVCSLPPCTENLNRAKLGGLVIGAEEAANKLPEEMMIERVDTWADKVRGGRHLSGKRAQKGGRWVCARAIPGSGTWDFGSRKWKLAAITCLRYLVCREVV